MVEVPRVPGDEDQAVRVGGGRNQSVRIANGSTAHLPGGTQVAGELCYGVVERQHGHEGKHVAVEALPQPIPRRRDPGAIADFLHADSRCEKRVGF